MITNTGKNIIAKYLIGQAPAFASFMAFGCGPKPLKDLSSVVTFRQAATETVTITTQAAHSFVPGSYVRILNVHPTLDGIHKIKTVPNPSSPTTFTYEIDLLPDLAVNSTAIAGQAIADYSDKKSLDLEMFRVPITSRGYVNEDGVSKVVLTAELPTEERYQISEIGLYSARSNPLASSNDSRVILRFSESENWEYHELTGTEDILYNPNAIGDIIQDPSANPYKAVQLDAGNPMFQNSVRANRYETPRFLNRAYFVAGNTATLKKEVNIVSAVGNGSKITYTTDVAHGLRVGDLVTVSGMTASGFNTTSAAISATPSTKIFEIAKTGVTGNATGFGKSTTNNLVIHLDSEHIHLNGLNVNLNKNSPTDELSFAFSIVNEDATVTDFPDNVRILLEFSNTDSSESSQYARFEVDLQNGTGSIENGFHDFANNRYVVVTKQLKDLSKTPSFNWGDVSVIKVYVSTFEDGVITDKYFVALDALRLDNVSTISPVYGLTGYSTITDPNKLPLSKELNTATLTEFRFGMDVQ